MKDFSIFLMLFVVVFLSCNTTKQNIDSHLSSIRFSLDSSALKSIVTRDSVEPLYDFFYEANDLDVKDFILRKEDNSITIHTLVPIYFGQSQSTTAPDIAFPGDDITIGLDSINDLKYQEKNNLNRNNEFYCNYILGEMYQEIRYAILEKLWHTDTLSVSSESEAKRLILKSVGAISYKKRLELDSLSKLYTLSVSFVKEKELGIQADSLTFISWCFNKYLNQVGDKYSLGKVYQELSHGADILTRNSPQMTLRFRHIVENLLQNIIIVKNDTTPQLQRDYTNLNNLFNLIEYYFTGEPRYYLLSKAIYSEVSRGAIIPKAIMEKYKKLCKNKIYKKAILIEQSRVQKESKNVNNNVLNIVSGKEQPLNDLIKKQEGKIILLDFWASWCGPCISELPYSFKLRKQYENKQIIFIYLSLDKNKANWIKTSIAEGLNNENNFLMLNNKAPFIKKYKISTIPRYILIGKDGKIISVNAPPPNDPNLQELINKNL